MIGFYTLFKREVARFMLDTLDTIAPPTMSVVLFLLIFGSVLGPRLGTVDGVPYAQFVMPGLLFMAVAINAFLNPAYSLLQSRWDGNIFDVLSSPMSSVQIALAVVLAGMVRGLVVGLLVALSGWALLQFQWVNPTATAFYLVLVSLVFASLGSVVGLWTKGWEGVNTISVFVIDPLVMLGGVFYSLDMVEGVPLLDALIRWNPLTAMVGGLRATMLEASGTSLAVGLVVTAGMAVVFLSASVLLFRYGYHLKA